MRRVVLCCLLTACFTKPAAPGADDAQRGDGAGSGSDADVVRDCTAIPFDGTADAFVRVNDFDAAFIGDPAMREDLEELFYTASAGDGTEMWQIQSARRDQPVGPFFRGQPLPFVTVGLKHADASLTADALDVFFIRFDGATPHAYVAVRASRVDAWSGAMLVEGLESFAISQLDISGDGLTLYVVMGSQLRFATRAMRSTPFILQPMAAGGPAPHPSVSTDGREIYYNGGTSVYRSTRMTTDEVFPAGTEFLTASLDADLSTDGQTLVAWTNLGERYIQVHTRSCPPAP